MTLGTRSRSAQPALAPQGQAVPLAIVQHGHQYLITDGYDNREGISEILEGFATVFALHLKYRIPLNLHLSGTLIEAIAWHSPVFFDWIKALLREGLLELVGSAYSQNIMTVFSPEHNLRQINETLHLYRRHLGVEPAEVRAFWVPERVWNTSSLARVLRSRRLLNSGYDYVLLDDRLAYPHNGRYAASEREQFDASSAPHLHEVDGGPGENATPPFGGEHLLPYWVDGAEGLIALPISGTLRYCIPPKNDHHWASLRQELRLAAASGSGAIALYADDLEKTAALGPWTSGRWKREGVAPYEPLLAWMKEEPAVEPVLISTWLSGNLPQARRPASPGAFFELARSWQAGEDYAGWWHARRWQPYRKLLLEAEDLLRHAAPNPRRGLWELAWKQLMACSYETAWHIRESDGSLRPAPWARAVASHVRSVFVIAAAARWEQERDGKASVQRIDIDRDGKKEVILKNDLLFAVFAPDFGGRLIYLFDLSDEGGRLVVGNPADDWNWQEELNQFMEVPRNHTGAFADVGHENDRYTVRAARSRGTGAVVELVNRQPGSSLAGAVKAFHLEAGSPLLEALYRLPGQPERFSVEFCLSPDYLVLLREGRWVITPLRRGSARGWRNGSTAVWVSVPPGEPVLWDVPERPQCGHGMFLRVTAYRPAFRLQLGVRAAAASARDPDSRFREGLGERRET